MNMRTLINLMESAGFTDMKLYHGTSTSSDVIRREGLTTGRHNAVFFTDNPQLAIEYAETDQERTGNDIVTIVSVKVSDLDIVFLTGDVDHTDEKDWQDSLAETDQCMYLRSIPANLLSFEETWTSDGEG